jgi:hypothetical protein
VKPRKRAQAGRIAAADREARAVATALVRTAAADARQTTEGIRPKVLRTEPIYQDTQASALVDAIERAARRSLTKGAQLEDVVHAVYAFAVAAARSCKFDRASATKLLDRYWAIDEIHEEAAEARRAGRLH